MLEVQPCLFVFNSAAFGASFALFFGPFGLFYGPFELFLGSGSDLKAFLEPNNVDF